MDNFTHKTVSKRSVFLKLVPELFPGVIINPSCAFFSDTAILLAISASKDSLGLTQAGCVDFVLVELMDDV